LLPYKVYEHPKGRKNRSFLDFLSLKIPRISVGRQIFEVLFGHPLLSKGSDLLQLIILGFVRSGKTWRGVQMWRDVYIHEFQSSGKKKSTNS